MNAQKYLYNLTPLRGIAALLTVVFHLNLGSNFLISLEFSPGFNKLYLMVDFFFVLSGFIMLHVYGTWFTSKVNLSSFKKFTVARFARVYPLHFITLFYLILLNLVFFILGGNYDNDPFSKASFSWESIPTNLLLLHSMNIHDWFTWNNASWSISTEWWMYMLFPFLVMGFSKLGRWMHWPVVLLCIGGYLLIIYYLQQFVKYPPGIEFVKEFNMNTLNVAYQFGFLRCMFGFIIGMVFYKFYQEAWAYKWLSNGYSLILLTILMGIFMHLYVLDLWIVLLFPFMIISAAYGSKSMNHILGSKPFQKIGDWSFAIYLVHQPMIYTMETIKKLNPQTATPTDTIYEMNYLYNWGIALGFISLTLLISYFVYEKFEVPSRKRINNAYE